MIRRLLSQRRIGAGDFGPRGQGAAERTATRAPRGAAAASGVPADGRIDRGICPSPLHIRKAGSIWQPMACTPKIANGDLPKRESLSLASPRSRDAETVLILEINQAIP